MAARSMADIAELFKKLKFRKKLIGGVDEMDVWKKLDMVQKEYQSLLDVKLSEKDAVLAEKDNEIARLTELLKKEVGHG